MSLTESVDPDLRSERSTTEYDVVVVGAGFMGLYALHRMREMGLRAKGYEAGDAPGGTWYWNRYPGAQCDIESMEYSYSFSPDLEQDWQWTEDFGRQPEIESYANHVADRFDLRPLIEFGTTVDRLRFDEDQNRWHIETDHGSKVTAKYVVAATGSLSVTNLPSFNGAESFRGEQHHTSQWPQEGVDFTGKRVGVIGTGSTGIQVIPVVAQEAEHLTVFQRTANFSMPSRNRSMDPDKEREFKQNYRARREQMRNSWGATTSAAAGDQSVFAVDDAERQRILEEAWEAKSGFGFLMSFNDVLTNPEANEVVAEFVRNKIRGIVDDPEVAELLCPKTHPIGTKRPCLDSGYYETFNRENVSLVDVRADPIVEVTPTGVRTTGGEHELDVLIYATGFDAMTGPMQRMNVTGAGEKDLREKWADGPTNYLGIMVAGYPNLFMVHGPGSPSVLAQMITSGEWQVEWIADRIKYMENHGYARMDTTQESESSWDQEVQMMADYTLFKQADSWYVGANIPGKPRVFMVYVGGFDRYRQLCEEAVADNQGFVVN